MPGAAKYPVAEDSIEIAPLVARATSLLERIQRAPFLSDSHQHSGREERLLERWCQVAGKGDWETLRKRLRWDGLDLSTARAAIALPALNQSPLPSWAETLAAIIREGRESVEPAARAQAANPVPFEDVFIPALSLARCRVRASGCARAIELI